MSQTPHTEQTDSPRLDEALADYLRRIDRGEAVDLDRFVAGWPDVADELRGCLEAAAWVEQMAGPTLAEESRAVAPHDTASASLPIDATLVPPTASARAAEAPFPEQFGRYRVVRPLGQGAMGMVFLAEDSQLQRSVALKTPSFAQDASGELLERFYLEARAAAMLRHPNICPVYDVGEIDGRHYISMAYIEGKPLSAYIQPKKLQAERQILNIVRKLALALQEAHERGIVHRDLKPANVMIDVRGEPIIMDFGLARKFQGGGDVRLTQSGTIVGSPAYMSPEQVEGHSDAIGPATDQYSLGVMLYELLTGELPFRGSMAAVIGQIVTKEPAPPGTLRPGLDARVEALCLKMMAKSAADRFPSLKAVATQIATLLKTPATAASSAPSSSTAGEGESPALPLSEPGTPTSSAAAVPHEAATMTRQNLVTLSATAKDCLARHAYEQVVHMLEQIPESQRTDEIRALLEQARTLTEQVARLLAEIADAERRHDGQSALQKAKELQRIKPGHRRVREIAKLYRPQGQAKASGEPRVGKPGRPVGAEGRFVWPAVAVGVAVFLLMLGAVTLYLRSGNAVVKVTINDPEIQVALQGRTLSIDSAQSSVKVRPGEETLTINYGELEFQTAKFTLKKGENPAVVVELLDDKLAAKFGELTLGEWPVKGGPIVGALTANRAGDRLLDRPEVAGTGPVARLPAAPAGSPIRWLGYSVHDSQVVPEIAGYVNLIQDRSWQTSGDALIQAARQHRVPVILAFQRQEFPDIETKLFDMIGKNRDVVAGVCFLSPYTASEGFSFEQVGGFGRRLKQTFPGISYWVSYTEAPANWRGPLPPVPDEVDVVEMAIYFDLSPPQVQSKVDRYLPGWLQRAGGRPVVLRWVSRPSWKWNGQGPLKTAPGTMRKCGELAEKHQLAGLTFDQYGPRSDNWSPGIETDLAAVQEIREMATIYGFSRREPTTHTNPEPGAPRPNDWQSLFNGRDLTGWKPMVRPDAWSVENGVILCRSGHGGGWLATERDYSDFELEFEYKLAPDGNSGVFLRIPDSGAIKGADFLEIQLLDDWGLRNRNAAPNQKTGALYGVVPPLQPGGYGPDRWYRMQITAVGPRITVTIDGTRVLEANLDAYPQATAAKPNLKRPAGKIAFQNYGSRVEFRNIRLREFSAAAPAQTRSSTGGTPPTLPNSIGMQFVRIPAGSFLQGSSDADSDARPSEKPQHRVQIASPFELGIHEVTVGQFRRFVDESGYRTDAERDPRRGFVVDLSQRDGFKGGSGATWRTPGFAQQDDSPVVLVSWNDATEFCRWLTDQEKREHRLPTEAEWEYVCRAGTQTRYWTGDEHGSLEGAANIADAAYRRSFPTGDWAVSWDDTFPATAPVGSFRANAFGLFDMHGNVYEWCADLYDERAYACSDSGSSQAVAGNQRRVSRGGSWASRAAFLRSATRDFGGVPTNAWNNTGFRVVRASDAVRKRSATVFRGSGRAISEINPEQIGIELAASDACPTRIRPADQGCGGLCLLWEPSGPVKNVRNSHDSQNSLLVARTRNSLAALRL